MQLTYRQTPRLGLEVAPDFRKKGLSSRKSKHFQGNMHHNSTTKNEGIGRRPKRTCRSVPGQNVLADELNMQVVCDASDDSAVVSSLIATEYEAVFNSVG